MKFMNRSDAFFIREDEITLIGHVIVIVQLNR